MVFSLAALAVFGSMAFFQSIHGLFSNFIMVVLTILCAAFAFGTHEIIFYGFLIPFLPNYGQALSLAALFAIPLLLLRVFFDVRFGGNMTMPPSLDRAGGAILGLMTATICTGMILICFQLLPFDVEIMGFRRIAENDRKTVWLNPDGLTVQLVAGLSNGSLSSTKRFTHQHPDYLMELHAARTIQRESLHIVPQNTFTIQRVWRLPDKGVLRRDAESGYKAISAAMVEPRAPYWWGVRIAITETAAQDSDGRYRYTGHSWRLAGISEDGEPQQYFASAVKRIGESTEKGKYVLFDTAKYEHQARAPSEAPVQELAFAIPEGFKPAFLEFKRSARVALTESMVEDPSSPAAPAPTAAAPRQPSPTASKTTPAPAPKTTQKPQTPQPKTQPPSESKESQAKKPDQPTEVDMSKGGRGRLSSRSAFKAVRSDEIPVFLPLTFYRSQGAAVINVYLMTGHVSAEIPADRKVSVGTVQKFQSGQGFKIIQIHTDPVKAQSTYGRALSFADRKLAQYRLTDSAGENHWPIGEVRIAKIGGKDYVEIQYHAEAIAEGIPERALTDARKIKENNLYTQGAEVIFVFLVPEDAQIRAFKSARFNYEIPGGI